MRVFPRLFAVSLVLAGTAGVTLWLGVRATNTTTAFGFWFEPVSYSGTPIGAITPGDLRQIDRVARNEIERAFAGFAVELTERRDATFRVVVAASVRDPRFRSEVDVAGASRAVAGFGGSGSVNFRLLAGHAIGTRPDGASRTAIIDAIGRGIGRAAVHEFAHQLLPNAPIHGPDRSSYEYGYASRGEQYYGQMHWDIALPMLERRLTRREGVGQQ